MSDSFTVGRLYPGRLQPGSLTQPAVKSNSSAAESSASFQNVLNQEMVRFSNHAAKRLEQRGIQLRPEQLGQIGQAIDDAAAKGSKDSLILMKDMAFIVNVGNRTVVTAMDGKSMKNNVFTQIDSAVIIH
ncbi:flagellar biosynthesis protein [Paenibacillus yonginensis]|uniref:Flagellar biosynthesis protein n=1 Tax=Paenibacillus yonginensis TaxID=1462996 RepID=A0A1B1MXV2_9BACL|nr:TIGR02530 family flagellar biosynthesis protein [Paenibacillus yonginensis]ANS74004.1 flagellar biosynthesis protein [Paenibacillus yonginensis]